MRRGRHGVFSFALRHARYNAEVVDDVNCLTAIHSCFMFDKSRMMGCFDKKFNEFTPTRARLLSFTCSAMSDSALLITLPSHFPPESILAQQTRAEWYTIRTYKKQKWAGQWPPMTTNRITNIYFQCKPALRAGDWQGTRLFISWSKSHCHLLWCAAPVVMCRVPQKVQWTNRRRNTESNTISF